MKKALLFILTAVIILSCTAAFSFANAEESVYYIKTGGTGNGSSPENAGTFSKAYKALSQSGGVIVVCDKYPLVAYSAPAHLNKITLTSSYGGVDYAKTNGAKLIFKGNFTSGGECEFRDITLESAVSYPSIFANNYPLTLGEGILCTKAEGISQYLSLMGGSNKKVSDKSATLTIKSGHWQRVRGGASVGGSTNHTVDLEIYGGEFVERLTLGSSASHSGDINADIYGGTFYQGIYAATLSSENTFSGNVTLSLHGGTFYNIIAPAPNTDGVLEGKFAVNITGGEFAHLVELRGSGSYKGNMISMLNSAIDIAEHESGTYTFTNPIRSDGADPWLFYHDGYYYYTSTTGSSTVKLTRATNIGDLIRSGGTAIYTPEPGSPWEGSTWSPTIVHYTDKEIGEGLGGWYMYFGGDDTAEDAADVNHRMYVLKCLDGDDLLGRWGNPITGQLNHPERVTAPSIPNFDDVWAAGQGDIRINGELYTLYVTEEGRGTADFHQTINIVKMKNPWTIEGDPGIICTPEYDWEMQGYRYNPTTDKWSPKVVEAATPVYGDDGSVFIVYSASNYTNQNYCLGQLKYIGGDPTDMSSWQKKPTPILKRSSELCGTGSASYVSDTSGQGWVIYNAYIGSTATGARYAIAEPYTASSSGVVISSPYSNVAASLSTVYTSEVNPMPMSDKISGFSYMRVKNSTPEKKHVINFLNDDGSVINSQTYLEWQTPALSRTPVKKSDGTYVYEFSHWDKKVVACTEKATYTACYTSVLLGDVNADGYIQNSDIILAIRSLSGWDIGCSKARFDMDQDGRINNRDAIALIRRIA